MKLTTHEIEVLKMLNGEREPEWGAWVGACVEVLAGRGFTTGGLRPLITDKGRAALAEAKRSQLHAEVMGS